MLQLHGFACTPEIQYEAFSPNAESLSLILDFCYKCLIFLVEELMVYI